LQERASLGLVTGILVVAYVVGVMIDAVGLVIGELFIDKIVCQHEPSDAELGAFYSGAEEHVMKYRDVQWTYYSLYRNLLLLAVPLAIVGGVALAKRGHCGWALVGAILSIGLGGCFFFAMRALLALYYNIPILWARNKPLAVHKSSAVLEDACPGSATNHS
jgi:hypothetical protein